MPLSRRESGRWQPNRFRWVKPQCRIARQRLKQARIPGLIPYGHERLRKWNRPGGSDGSRARQWFHPLSPATLRRVGYRRSRRRARIGATMQAGMKR